MDHGLLQPRQQGTALRVAELHEVETKFLGHRHVEKRHLQELEQ